MKTLKYFTIIVFVTLINKGFAQCQNVCVVGTPTVAITGGTFTVTGGGTSVDSLIQGNNQSTNAKELTLNYVNGSINTLLGKAGYTMASGKYTIAQYDSITFGYINYISNLIGITNNSLSVLTQNVNYYNTTTGTNNVKYYDSLNSVNTTGINNYIVGSNNTGSPNIAVPSGYYNSGGTSRTHFNVYKQQATTTQTLTVGGISSNVYYVKTIIVNVVNTSTTTASVNLINDISNGIRIPITVQPTISALVQPNSYSQVMTFEEPAPFQQGIVFIIGSGACKYDITVIGWYQ
jgi:hypothetical protein